MPWTASWERASTRSKSRPSSRDGGLEGPDLELLESVVRHGTYRVVASGGIRSIEDLLAVRRLGCVGAIVGRALYEGGLDLRAAIRATQSERTTG